MEPQRLIFAVAADERYDFIARTIRRFGYGRLKRVDKAVVLRFLERVSGYPIAAFGSARVAG